MSSISSVASGDKTFEDSKLFLRKAARNVLARKRPVAGDIRGVQAVVAVGYKSHHFGRGQQAFLIRSSWGSQWGDNGNGWLPVAFLRKQLAKDFWTLVSGKWLDLAELSSPTVIDSVANTGRKSY